MVPNVRRLVRVAALVAVAVAPGCGGGDLESDESVELDEAGDVEEEDEVDTSESPLAADNCNLANACLDASCEQYWECTASWLSCVAQRLRRDAACVAS